MEQHQKRSLYQSPFQPHTAAASKLNNHLFNRDLLSQILNWEGAITIKGVGFSPSLECGSGSTWLTERSSMVGEVGGGGCSSQSNLLPGYKWSMLTKRAQGISGLEHKRGGIKLGAEKLSRRHYANCKGWMLQSKWRTSNSDRRRVKSCVCLLVIQSRAGEM